MKRNSKIGKTKEPRRTRRSPASDKPYGVPANESREIVLAIRRGKVDALVTAGTDGDQVLMLQNADHPYRVLVETINDGVATLDSAGIILYANSRMAAILRVPVKNFIGTSLQSHVVPSEHEVLQCLIAEGLSNSAQGEIKLDAAEGRPRLIRLAFNPIKNSDPRTVCVVATELTEMVEANEALRSNEESLRQLSARLLKLQDEERRRIARDLHDITGQKLAVQSMALGEVLASQSTTLDPKSKRILSECAELTKQVGDEVRTLSYLLHPPLLDELGLASAAKWYAEGFQRRTGIQVKVDIGPDFVRLPPDVEVALFRVIQESLTNVHRYSGSPKAHVQMKVTATDIEVCISDFGRGINSERPSPTTGQSAPLGVGIQGMKERIRQLGGKLEIASRPHKGTEVTAKVPLSELRVTDPLESANSTEQAPAPVRDDQPIAQPGVSPSRILVVDDHEMLRQGIRAMVHAQTDLVICGEATNGQDAVDKVIALRPDLVILDINLPVLNGLVAVRQILRHRPQTKILIFTVHDSEQTVKEVHAAGAHGHLSKNTGSADLLRVVRSLLEDRSPSLSAAVGSDG